MLALSLGSLSQAPGRWSKARSLLLLSGLCLSQVPVRAARRMVALCGLPLAKALDLLFSLTPLWLVEGSQLPPLFRLSLEGS